MTFLVASAPPIAGKFVVRLYPGHGILGADLPTEGDNGGSPALNDNIDPAKRYAWRVVTPPSATLLTIYPDLTFEQERNGADDGDYPWTYKLLEDGQDAGNATVSTHFGVVEHLISALGSQQVNHASDVSVKQTHLVTAIPSHQVNHASPISAGQAGASSVTVAPSMQTNHASSVSVGQTHLVTSMPSRQVNHAVYGSPVLVYSSAPSGGGYRRNFNNASRPKQRNTTRP